MDDPRLPEEIEIRDRNASNGDRYDHLASEAVESDDEPLEIVHGTNNIFRDLQRPNPDLRAAKATLAAWIIAALDQQKLSTREAEAKTGIAHSEFSRIRNAKLTRFTLDRLFLIFHRLEPGKEVVVEIKGLS